MRCTNAQATVTYHPATMPKPFAEATAGCTGVALVAPQGSVLPWHRVDLRECESSSGRHEKAGSGIVGDAAERFDDQLGGRQRGWWR